MKEKFISFIKLIWRQSYIVVSFALLGTAVMSLQAWHKPTLYRASQTLTINPSKIDPQHKNSLENDVTVRLYSQVEESEESAIRNLIERNDLFKEERANGESADVLVEKLSRGIVIGNLTVDKNSVIALDLSFVSANPENAKAVTSALVKQLINSRTDEQNQIKVLSSCCEQTKIVAPKRWLMITFGLLAGLFVGVLFVLARGRKDL